MNRALALLTLRQAADFLGVSEGTIYRWNHAKNGPPRRLIGKRYYYQRALLTQWLESPPAQVRLTRLSESDRRPAASQSTLRDSLRVSR